MTPLADLCLDAIAYGPHVALWRTRAVRWLRARVERWAFSGWTF